jgi:hypothetical protein
MAMRHSSDKLSVSVAVNAQWKMTLGGGSVAVSVMLFQLLVNAGSVVV